jgi:two-component system cell cycle sensor histidine kinase/response regulator CckA
MGKENPRKESSGPPKVAKLAGEERGFAPFVASAEQIAHELGNIFMTVSFSCAQLLAGIAEDSPLHASATTIAQAASEGRTLSRKLGSLFYHAARVEPVNLNQAIEATATRLRGLIPSNVQLALALADSPVLIEADFEDIERLITNLVIGACDAMEQGGTLTIRTAEFPDPKTQPPPKIASTAEDFGKLTVEHAGQGLRPEALNNILRPSTSGNTLGEAGGMELAIVDSVVTRNGGYIEVESDEHSGTKISVFLPKPVTGARESEGPQDKSA